MTHTILRENFGQMRQFQTLSHLLDRQAYREQQTSEMTKKNFLASQQKKQSKLYISCLKDLKLIQLFPNHSM